MTVYVGKDFQPVTRWIARDINDIDRIGTLTTENGKRYITQNGKKYQVKPNTRPQVYK